MSSYPRYNEFATSIQTTMLKPKSKMNYDSRFTAAGGLLYFNAVAKKESFHRSLAVRAPELLLQSLPLCKQNGCRSSCLLVDLLLDSSGGLGLLGGQEAAQPAQSLVADDKGSGDGGAALGDKAFLLSLLDLGRVDGKNVVAALKTLVVREEDQRAGVIVKVGGGLLDEREVLVDAVEGLVAEGVGALDVRRDEPVRLGQPGQHGGSEGLVCRIAELDGALSVLIGPDGVDAVADERVVEQVLPKISTGVGMRGLEAASYLEESRVGTRRDVAVDLGNSHCECVFGDAWWIVNGKYRNGRR